MKGIRLMLQSLIGVVLCLTMTSPIFSVMNPRIDTNKSILLETAETHYTKPEDYEESLTLRDHPYPPEEYDPSILIRETPYTEEELAAYFPQETEATSYGWYNIPTYWDMVIEKHPVLIECTEAELDLLTRTMFLEAGAESDECIRAVTDIAFNQLNSGLFGDSMTSVLYWPSNYTETVYNAPYVDPAVLGRVREIVMDVYYNGISLPRRIIFYRNAYFHGYGYPEFTIDNVYFSSSVYYQPED